MNTKAIIAIESILAVLLAIVVVIYAQVVLHSFQASQEIGSVPPTLDQQEETPVNDSPVTAEMREQVFMELQQENTAESEVLPPPIDAASRETTMQKLQTSEEVTDSARQDMFNELMSVQ